MGIGGPSESYAAGWCSADDFMPEKCVAGLFGCLLAEIRFVDPLAILFDVGLKKNRDAFFRTSRKNKGCSLNKPVFPLLKREGGELGSVRKRGDDGTGRELRLGLEPLDCVFAKNGSSV